MQSYCLADARQTSGITTWPQPATDQTNKAKSSNFVPRVKKKKPLLHNLIPGRMQL
jgi:hypothetical protein